MNDYSLLIHILLGFADLEMLNDIIKENYSYWELECQKEENCNEEEVTSSNTTTDKRSTEEPSKKEATPSNENKTLTAEGNRSTSRKENEENSCVEANKSTLVKEEKVWGKKYRKKWWNSIYKQLKEKCNILEGPHDWNYFRLMDILIVVTSWHNCANSTRILVKTMKPI